jgi:hypothetical protein
MRGSLAPSSSRVGFFDIIDVVKNIDEVIDFVAVDRAEIFEVKRLEKHAGRHEGFEGLFGPFGELVDVFTDAGQFLEKKAELLAQLLQFFGGKGPAQEGGEGAHIAGDGHLVIVEDDDEVPLEDTAGLVQPFKGEAGGQRAVTDHGDHLGLFLLDKLTARDSEAGGNGGAAVPGGEGVERALAPAREPGNALMLSQGVERFPAAGEDFVGIGLVADIPDHLVVGGVEDIMDGNGEVDRAQAGRQMPAGARNDIDDLAADLGGEFGQPLPRQPLQVGRGVYGFKQAHDQSPASSFVALHHVRGHRPQGVGLGIETGQRPDRFGRKRAR